MRWQAPWHERTHRRGGYPINTTTGRRIAAVVPVHLLGHPADVDAIRSVADTYGLAVVEDAAQALGAGYHGRPAGCFIRISNGQLHLNKAVTAGAGGALLLNDDGQAARGGPGDLVRRLR